MKKQMGKQAVCYSRGKTGRLLLSLNMGFNVFKYLNLGIDFGIKDFNIAGKNVEFTDIINLGGR